MASRQVRVFFDRDLKFPEGLRWHRGELWFSDFHRREVLSIGAALQLKVRAFVGGQPSGLGFRPDGTPLVASVYDRNVLAIAPGHLQLAGNPGKVVNGPINDMAVDRVGRAYVTGFGYEAMYEPFDESKTTRIAMVDLDGNVSMQGHELHMPNGIAFNREGTLLVVSETTRNRLTAFDVAPDGALSNGRLFADLGHRSPDGICLDIEGAVWVACWRNGVVVRVRDGGELVEEIRLADDDSWVPSCALGGENGRTLFCSIARTDIERARKGVSEGSIVAIQVDVPGFEWRDGG